MTKPTTVDAHLTGFDGETRQRLERLRALITTAAPRGAGVDRLRHAGVQAERQTAHLLRGYAANIGLYGRRRRATRPRRGVVALQAGKGSVQFPLNQEMPWDLIERIVAFKADELSAR